jgi:hypothetical protein
MIAVGVARPSAQGQAITSTATALTSAWVKSPDSAPPGNEAQQRDGGDHRHEDRRHLVGQALHRRLGTLRLLHQPDDAGQQACRLPTPVARQRKTPSPFTVAAKTMITRCLDHRHALAGEHGLVGRRFAFQHFAIDRHRLAGRARTKTCPPPPVATGTRPAARRARPMLSAAAGAAAPRWPEVLARARASSSLPSSTRVMMLADASKYT